MPVRRMRTLAYSTLAAGTLAATVGLAAPSALADPAPSTHKATVSSITKLAQQSWPTLKRGSKGTDVRALQYMLRQFSDATQNLAADGDFGANTQKAVRFYQESRGVKVDGIVGPLTWAKLVNEFPVKKGDSGNAVKAAQRELDAHGYKLTVDGAFGARTDSAVRSFQKAHKLSADGIVGPLTWHALIAS
jgi:peptidoglycan hydrolase-like protein with peptidoglycan-binding domain